MASSLSDWRYSFFFSLSSAIWLNLSTSWFLAWSWSSIIFFFSSSVRFLGYAFFTGSSIIFLALVKWVKNLLISSLKWSSAFGYTILTDSASSSWAAAPFAGGPFPPFGGGALPPLPPFAAAAATSSWSFLRTLSLFSFKISSSSSVNSSPANYFFLKMNFYLEILAFSARSGSSFSQDALRAFSLSSLSVSLIRAKVSLQ